MNVLLAVLLVTVGLINAVPGLAALVPGAVGRVYGVDASDRNVEVLLRHRAILLFLVGAGLIVSAFVTPVRDAALVAGAVSMSSYAVLALGNQSNAHLRRVAYIDIGALLLLAAAVVIRFLV